jgi:hypothetical protein
MQFEESMARKRLAALHLNKKGPEIFRGPD